MDKFSLNKKPTMPMDAVMHVETSAKTSAKSVLIAFQVNNSDRTLFFSTQTVKSGLCMRVDAF